MVNSVCLRLIGALASTPHKSNKSLLISSAVESSLESSGNEDKSRMQATSGLHRDIACSDGFNKVLVASYPGEAEQ